jgi:hypothetical protein
MSPLLKALPSAAKKMVLVVLWAPISCEEGQRKSRERDR